MSDVLVIQNSKNEGIGNLGNLLESDGFKLNVINAKKEKISDNDYALGVILGAPESVNDNLSYLDEEEKLIRNFYERKIPMIGICLGSQLIAKTFGARVYRANKKEIGFYNDLEYNKNSNLFSGIDNPFTVFHWHGETFDLPTNAIHLVSSKNFKNQAFQIGSLIALQFHLEVDEKMIQIWLEKTKENLQDNPGVEPQTIRDQINENLPIIKKNLDIFYKNFKSEFNL